MYRGTLQIITELLFVLELAIEAHLQDYGVRNLKYVTPYEILTNKKSDYCSESTFKPSSSVLVSLNSTSKLFSSNLNDTYNTSTIKRMKEREKEAVWFMRGLMDECTHLKNFDVPIDTSLIIAICATLDAYVPKKGISTLEEIWPGSTIQYINCGHVGAYLYYLDLFR